MSWSCSLKAGGRSKCRNVCERTWMFMKVCEHSWTFVNVREHSWTYVNIREHSWTIMNVMIVGKRSWTLVNVCEHLWTSVNVHERPWTSMNVRECTWISVNASESQEMFATRIMISLIIHVTRHIILHHIRLQLGKGQIKLGIGLIIRACFYSWQSRFERATRSLATFVRSQRSLRSLASQRSASLRSLRSLALFTGSLTHFAHSLVGRLKFMNLCSRWNCV